MDYSCSARIRNEGIVTHSKQHQDSSITDFQYIIVLVLTLRCWYVTNGLRIAVQGSANDIVAGYEEVDVILKEPFVLRRLQGFSKIKNVKVVSE
jgi:hypothetical protein